MSGEALLDRYLQTSLGLSFVIEAVDRATGDAASDRALDGGYQRPFRGRGKGEGIADLAGAGGSPDAMNVVFGHHWGVEVDLRCQGQLSSDTSGKAGGI